MKQWRHELGGTTHAQGAAKARDFSRIASLCTAETGSPLEETGFEPSDPPQEEWPFGGTHGALHQREAALIPEGTKGSSPVSYGGGS